MDRANGRKAWGPLALAVLVALSGCLGGGGGTATRNPSTATSSHSTSAPAPYDGHAALELAKGLALGADGEPRFRMPGTPGQREGAEYLWSQTDVPGWSRHWQNFTGTDYLALDRHSVSAYDHGTSFCPEEDWKALPSWPFSNLYAVHPGTSGASAGGRTLVVAAHWDSQMHSQNDANASRLSWPDPGANDGASGVGVLLQLMRHLSTVDTEATVVALFVDGEDGFFDCYPLAGSLMFAQHPPLPVGRFLLLDMVGDGNARFVKESYSRQSDPALIDLVWRHGRADGGGDLFTDLESQIDDDHLAFIAAGIPSMDLIDAGRGGGNPFPPQWDTTQDTVDKLSARTMGIVGQALADSLVDADLTARWPSPQPPKGP